MCFTEEEWEENTVCDGGGGRNVKQKKLLKKLNSYHGIISQLKIYLKETRENWGWGSPHVLNYTSITKVPFYDSFYHLFSECP